MLAFFVLGGAALLLLIRPDLLSAGRDEGLLDLGFMQPGEYAHIRNPSADPRSTLERPRRDLDATSAQT